MTRILLTTVLALFCLTTLAQKQKKLVDKTVQRASIEAHLKFISSDALRGRDTPSQGLEVAAEYLRTQLELYGVRAFPEYPDYYQEVKMKKTSKPKTGIIQADSTQFQINEDFLLLAGEDMKGNGEVIYLDYATPDEINRSEVKGKMIVANAGDGQTQSVQLWYSMTGEKREAAHAAGAVGLIELYTSTTVPWQLLVKFFSGDQVALDQGERDAFPHIWLNNPKREANALFEKSKNVQLSLKDGVYQPFIVHNIVGYLEGTDASLKEAYIAYTAHYDHVGVGAPDSTGDTIYNGTRDNAIGTVTVLEAAKNHAKHPLKRPSLFVLFAGEEKGLLGSQWFVNHSPVPLPEIKYCFNSDNGGYNNTNLATVIGLDRTTARQELVTAIEAYGLKAADDANFKEQNLFDRSDNVSFAAKGIPAPSFGMGVDAFDEKLLSTYHKPADEFDTVDMDYLFKFYRAYVLAGRLIANRKGAPFWVEGDKYYERGVELYGK